uniref:Protein BIC2 n=1 Tax=Cicer arietinum TaxID=3827 RepID=A0A1S2XG43_CICAR|nr:protein BIC2 [Cicer arietinum]
MDQENILTRNISSWETRKPTCHVPNSLSIEQNDKLKCKSLIDDDDDEAKEVLEHNNHENDSYKVEEITGREKLKRHREEVKGKIELPKNWEKEKMLKEWVDYTTFDASFAPHKLIVIARDALIEDARKARSQRLRIHT